MQIASLAGNFHTGLLTVHAQFNGTAHTVSADVGWPAEPYRLDAVVPAFVGGDELRLRIDGLRSELLYFAVVTSGP